MRKVGLVMMLSAAMGLGMAGVALVGCSGDTAQTEDGVAPEPAKPEPKAMAKGPLPGLILTQARFEDRGDGPKPQPATLWLWRTDGENWTDSLLTDPASKVFHKGMWWNDGLLTIAGDEARLTHWKKVGEAWKPTVLWKAEFGGKHDRFRDIEIADVTGDGKENFVIATHDAGVIAVGTLEGETWSFVELDRAEDTFVHEVEIGDVDGDGVAEFYATPSGRNRASGASQPGSVVRYDFKGGKFERTMVVDWSESHAKEILVADLDGEKGDELYAVREATVKVTKLPNGKKKKERLEPVKIVQMVPGKGGWSEKVIATLDDEQCRFLLMADANHDGKQDLIAAGKKSGLWLIERTAEGKFTPSHIAKDSSGYEHTTHAADLDGDGKVEIYVASDDQNELRRYLWNGKSFDSKVIGVIPPSTLTWNIQDAKF